MGLFMLCPSLSRAYGCQLVFVFAMCSIVTPPLLLLYYIVRANTYFRSLVTLHIPLLFSLLCQIESLLCLTWELTWLLATVIVFLLLLSLLLSFICIYFILLILVFYLFRFVLSSALFFEPFLWFSFFSFPHLNLILLICVNCSNKNYKAKDILKMTFYFYQIHFAWR